MMNGFLHGRGRGDGREIWRKRTRSRIKRSERDMDMKKYIINYEGENKLYILFIVHHLNIEIQLCKVTHRTSQ